MATAQFCRTQLVSRPKLHRSFCEATATAVSCYDHPASQALPRSVLDFWQAKKIVTGEILGRREKTRTTYSDDYWESWRSGCIGYGFVSGPDHVQFLGLWTDHFPSTYDSNIILKDISEDIILEKRYTFFDVRPLLDPFLLKGFTPNHRTFTILIDLYCKHGNYQNAINTALFEMKAAGIKPSDKFVRRMIDGMCTHVGPNFSYQLLKKLRRNQIQVPFACYNTVVKEFCKRKMIHDAEIVWSDMKQLGVSLDEHTYINYLFKEYCNDIGGEGLLKAWTLQRQKYSDEGIEFNRDLVSIVIGGLCRNGLMKEGLNLLNEYRVLGLNLDAATYGRVIDYYSKLGDINEAINLFKEMKRAGKKIYFVHFFVLFEGFCQHGGRIEDFERIICAEMVKNLGMMD